MGSSTTRGRRGRSPMRARPCRLPHCPTGSAPRMHNLSRLNTQPACTPVNASPKPSRAPTHDSGPVWAANPSPYGSFIRYSSPASRRTEHVTDRMRGRSGTRRMSHNPFSNALCRRLREHLPIAPEPAALNQAPVRLFGLWPPSLFGQFVGFSASIAVLPRESSRAEIFRHLKTGWHVADEFCMQLRAARIYRMALSCFANLKDWSIGTPRVQRRSGRRNRGRRSLQRKEASAQNRIADLRSIS